MSENKTFLFKTLIKNTGDVKPRHWVNNKYIRGRISGISFVMCGMDHGPYKRVKDGYIQSVICEPEKYVEFQKLIEKIYPGLCVFNYKEEESCEEES